VVSVKVGVVDGPVALDREVDEITRETAAAGGGALVMFMGYVKGLVDGRSVYELEYSVYEPHTTRILESIARETAVKYKLLAVRIYHRRGRLKPGEPTVYIIVAATDRDTAFNAAREILERVKREPPIFKLEKREDGEYWVVGDGFRVKRSGV